jgi:hypothetical protein
MSAADLTADYHLAFNLSPQYAIRCQLFSGADLTLAVGCFARTRA